MIVLLAVLADTDEWLEVEAFEKTYEKWLWKFLRLEHGILNEDAFKNETDVAGSESLHTLNVYSSAWLNTKAICKKTNMWYYSHVSICTNFDVL